MFAARVSRSRQAQSSSAGFHETGRRSPAADGNRNAANTSARRRLAWANAAQRELRGSRAVRLSFPTRPAAHVQTAQTVRCTSVGRVSTLAQRSPRRPAPPRKISVRGKTGVPTLAKKNARNGPHGGRDDQGAGPSSRRVLW
ncbi:hypothetical protein MRX96_027610 [Rhipicephalus microplus]